MSYNKKHAPKPCSDMYQDAPPDPVSDGPAPPDPAPDAIAHPPHYTGTRVRVSDFDPETGTACVECIDVINALALNFSRGSALKYLWRAGKKGERPHDAAREREDIGKARQFLEFELRRLEEVRDRRLGRLPEAGRLP